MGDMAAHRILGERVRRLRQALWDIYGILGFDQDGDPTPAACGDVIGLVVDAAREFRKDYDDLLNELPARGSVVESNTDPTPIGWELRDEDGDVWGEWRSRDRCMIEATQHPNYTVHVVMPAGWLPGGGNNA